jgi:hypothetical protein
MEHLGGRVSSLSFLSSLEKRQSEAGGNGVVVKDLTAHPEGNTSGEKLGQRGVYADYPGRVFDPGAAICYNRQQARHRGATKVARKYRQCYTENEEDNPSARLSIENRQLACVHSKLMANRPLRA